MIACVTPALNCIEETLCVLKYANRARNIKNKARVNVERELPEISSAEEVDSDGSETEEGEQFEDEDEEVAEDIVDFDVIGDDELNEAAAMIARMIMLERRAQIRSPSRQECGSLPFCEIYGRPI